MSLLNLSPQEALKSPAEYVMMAMKGSFTKNKSLLRHVRTGHQGMKRTDNEKRKRDVTDKVRKQGHLACTDIRTCEVPVESVTQAVFKPPAEYVMMTMKGSFTKNKSLLRHVRTGHQGMKRTDNEKRKKDQESTDKARKQGLLACGSWAACEESVESNPPGAVSRTLGSQVWRCRPARIAPKTKVKVKVISLQKYLYMIYYI